jgi:four helix bundle protein
MLYEDLEVFKQAHLLVLEVYRVTENFPRTEVFRIVNQMIRSAYSVPANIAEGNSRNTTKDYVNFLYIARGSLSELRYFLLLSKDLKYIDVSRYQELKEKCDNVGRLLNGLIKSLKKREDDRY